MHVFLMINVFPQTPGCINKQTFPIQYLFSTPSNNDFEINATCCWVTWLKFHIFASWFSNPPEIIGNQWCLEHMTNILWSKNLKHVLHRKTPKANFRSKHIQNFHYNIFWIFSKQELCNWEAERRQHIMSGVSLLHSAFGLFLWKQWLSWHTLVYYHVLSA